jgi:hypothetical protein
MALKKFVVGCFEDEKVLFPAVSKVRKAGYKFHDIYTPFPVHGLDKAMGLRHPHCRFPFWNDRYYNCCHLHDLGFHQGLAGEHWW